MPLLLAIAEAGGGCGDGRGGDAYVVSGPYAKEIEMNFDTNVLGPGNPANRSIGRAAELMWRNLGGNIPNVNNCGVWGRSAARMGQPERRVRLQKRRKLCSPHKDGRENQQKRVPARRLP